MKEYDLIIVGTGSALNYTGSIIEMNPDIKIAVIDKDDPGGICLTRGCIPSKLLLYPADLIRLIGSASKFGIDVELKKIDFRKIMERMENIISEDIEMIRRGLSSNPNIDYFKNVAEFAAPYKIKVGSDIITSKKIFLCTGSKPLIPDIKGLEDAGYHTSDTILKIKELPGSIAIIGGGYIAAEYGHFFSAMGSRVTVIGRNPQFIPEEEPEISALAIREMSKYMEIITGNEVLEVRKEEGRKKIHARDQSSSDDLIVSADEILVASGRGPNMDISPEKGGIKTDEKGWIAVNEYLETSQSGIWAFGDADGKYLFKHVANYESMVVFYNAFLRKKMKVDYHAIPHAVFSYPEIASVGLKEKEGLEKYGEILIGFQRYEDTAKGIAMEARDFFVKVIVEKDKNRILGSHIIGPHASILIQEIVDLMYTKEEKADPILYGMHIHPALSEVVERAFNSLMPPEDYHHILVHLGFEKDQ